MRSCEKHHHYCYRSDCTQGGEVLISFSFPLRSFRDRLFPHPHSLFPLCCPDFSTSQPFYVFPPPLSVPRSPRNSKNITMFIISAFLVATQSSKPNIFLLFDHFLSAPGYKLSPFVPPFVSRYARITSSRYLSRFLPLLYFFSYVFLSSYRLSLPVSRTRLSFFAGQRDLLIASVSRSREIHPAPR